MARELGDRLADLEQANSEIRDARRPTLNIAEDVAEARDQAGALYRDLQGREACFRARARH